MLKNFQRIRTSTLLIGLLFIAKINITPHMPFYGFRDFEFGLEQETRDTAEVTLTENKNAKTSIPVQSPKTGENHESGLFVEVVTNSRDVRIKEFLGADQSSRPTLKVLAYVSIIYFSTFPLYWVIQFINRRRTSRPA